MDKIEGVGVWLGDSHEQRISGFDKQEEICGSDNNQNTGGDQHKYLLTQIMTLIGDNFCYKFY